MKPYALSFILGIILAGCSPAQQAHLKPPVADVIVVGAGIAGISAALEAAQLGGSVVVVDMASVFGGHAVMSEGGLSIVGSPLQRARSIDDTPDLGYTDFIRWGEDANEAWVRYYVEHSVEEIYHWVTSMGVEFSDVLMRPGNSVARFHLTKGRGLGLVAPMYRKALEYPGIRFLWNQEMTDLLVDNGRVVGVQTRDLRSGSDHRLTARAVILATGGFQNNLALLREHWPDAMRFPETVLLGSGVNSTGSGHRIAQRVGAALSRMDHQWNYPWGLRDPRHPGMSRGLSARNTASIWVNAQGKRFVNEMASPKLVVPALLAQPQASYWAIFDVQTKGLFWIAGSDWIDFKTIERVIFSDSSIVKSASSITELAAKIGVSPHSLEETIRRYNEQVAAGDDVDFGRFGRSAERFRGFMIPAAPPKQIHTPPFYAVQFFILTRKSMGGVAIDTRSRVITNAGAPISGLFAAGELTGLAGINGKAGLEGTFLGPSIVTGRVAARTAMSTVASPQVRPRVTKVDNVIPAATGSTRSCLECHDLPKQTTLNRPGYWHFERSHQLVLTRGHVCTQCHQELHPYDARRHRIDRVAQINSCAACHGT